ncbi:DUF3533 domain-containing protein [Pelomyxa schiedti]|nr:DUF3533 domain-containing protein [Pelomyxa schiedti]
MTDEGVPREGDPTRSRSRQSKRHPDTNHGSSDDSESGHHRHHHSHSNSHSHSRPHTREHEHSSHHHHGHHHSSGARSDKQEQRQAPFVVEESPVVSPVPQGMETTTTATTAADVTTPTFSTTNSKSMASVFEPVDVESNHNSYGLFTLPSCCLGDENTSPVKVERRRVWFALALVSGLTVGGLVAYEMIIGAFYLTALWNPIENFSTMDVALCNRDYGWIEDPSLNVGHQIVGIFNQSAIFRFTILENSTSQEWIEDRVADNTFWFALIFPENYSDILLGSYTGYPHIDSNGTYTNPVLEIYDEGKQYTTTLLMRKVETAMFDKINYGAAELLHSGDFGAQDPDAPLGVLVTPVYRTGINLHPVGKYGWYFASYISLVILWISVLLSHNLVYLTFHRKLTESVKMKFWVMAACRFVMYLLSSCSLGLFTAIIISWYDIPITNGFGKLFLLYWLAALAFAGIMCPLFSYMSEGGMIVATMLLILQLATCDGVYARDTLPPFFHGVGPILPFFHCVPIFRYITLGACHNSIGEHVGVLFAWFLGGFAISIPGWYWEIGEKALRMLLPVFIDAFDHFSKAV